MSTATATNVSNCSTVTHKLDTAAIADRIESIGQHGVRYSLVAVLVWIGAMKFTAYEAENISGLVANSPLMSWAYSVFSTRQFSSLLGVVELLTAALIALRPYSARTSAVGSVLAVGMFLTTLTFLFSTPGVFEGSVGFAALSVLPGQFLIKDLVLLGASVWATGEALRAAAQDATLKQAELQGYDPVAYFTQNQPVRGQVEITARHGGRQYHFASSHHRDLFEQNPEKYLPEYGGYCAFGVAMGQLFDVAPQTGQVIDGKLYLNLNRKILADFNKDTASYIRQADSKWPDVKQQAAA